MSLNPGFPNGVTIYRSQMFMRIQGSFDRRVEALEKHTRLTGEQASSIVVQRPNIATDSIWDIASHQIVGSFNPDILYDHNINIGGAIDDFSFDKACIFGQVAGIPALPPDVKILGTESTTREVLRDYLLRGIRFAGVADGQFINGPDHKSAQTDGIPVDIYRVQDLFIPIDSPIAPFTPVKLSIYLGDTTGHTKGANRLTLAPVEPDEIATQMKRAANSYSKVVKQWAPSKDGNEQTNPLFLNVSRMKAINSSVVMKDEVAIGHDFLLGVLGAVIRLNELCKGKCPLGDVLKLLDANDYGSNDKVFEVLAAFSDEKVSVTTATTPTQNNLANNCFYYLSRPCVEQTIHNNSTIGSIITQKKIPDGYGDNKLVMASLYA